MGGRLKTHISTFYRYILHSTESDNMEDYQQMIDRAYNFMDEIEDKRAFFAACNTTRTIQSTLLNMKNKDSDEYNRLLEKQVEAQTYIWSAVSTGMRNIILGNPKPSGK